MKEDNVIIQDGLYYIGVNDRKTPLFENMWPLENGVSYNSYLLSGEKNIILDLVLGSEFEKFLAKIKQALGDAKIDYVIVNHMEPDHSGSIPLFLKAFSDVKFIGNKKTFEFMNELYQLNDEEKFIVVKDGQTLTLGDRKLTFYTTPMVHWPESMVTYEEKTKTLFSQDIFGGFGSLDGSIFDDEVNWDFHEFDTRRYYTNIVGKFSSQVQVALKKLSSLEIKTICPVHGVVWRKNPEKIVELYDKLSKYETQEGCVIAYGSMYGSTEEMAESLARYLSEEGVKNIKVYDVSKTHISYILTDIWKYKGLFLGSCTYNNGLYPPMNSLFDVLVSNKLKNHIYGVFGSYGWSGGGVSKLEKLPEQGGSYEFIGGSTEARFSAKSEDFKNLKSLAKKMAEAIGSNN